MARCVDDVFRPQLTRAVQRALRAAGAASAVSSVAAAGLDPEERAARGGGGGGSADGGDGAAPAKERNDKVGGPLERLACRALAPVSACGRNVWQSMTCGGACVLVCGAPQSGRTRPSARRRSRASGRAGMHAGAPAPAGRWRALAASTRRALTASARRAQDDEDENAEADPDFREGKLAWAGGRGEMKSYEAGDREDRAAAAAARAALRRRDADPEARRRAFGSCAAWACQEHRQRVHARVALGMSVARRARWPGASRDGLDARCAAPQRGAKPETCGPLSLS